LLLFRFSTSVVDFIADETHRRYFSRQLRIFLSNLCPLTSFLSRGSWSGPSGHSQVSCKFFITDDRPPRLSNSHYVWNEPALYQQQRPYISETVRSQPPILCDTTNHGWLIAPCQVGKASPLPSFLQNPRSPSQPSPIQRPSSRWHSQGASLTTALFVHALPPIK
jgi:hypothetical protein